MSNKLKYIRELDGVRAIAAWMVMFLHFFQLLNVETGIFHYLNKIAIFGGTGVSLFFVLSGFLITRILITTKNEQSYFKNFYIRRSLRIFPLYYLFLFVYYFIIPILFKEKYVSIHDQMFYWTYLQNIAITFNWQTNGPAHFWSLAVEEHFYLIWPLLVYFLNPKWLFRLIIGILIFSFLLRIYFSVNSIEVFYFTFTRFDELALGGMLALFELKGFLNKSNFNKFFYTLIIIAIPTILLWTLFSGLKNQYIQIVKFNLLSATYFCIVAMLLTSKSYINKLLQTPFIIYSGKISYGLYVWHPICFMIYHKYITMGILFDFIFSFILTYFIASISYYSFENIFLKYKKHFI